MHFEAQRDSFKILVDFSRALRAVRFSPLFMFVCYSNTVLNIIKGLVKLFDDSYQSLLWDVFVSTRMNSVGRLFPEIRFCQFKTDTRNNYKRNEHDVVSMRNMDFKYTRPQTPGSV